MTTKDDGTTSTGLRGDGSSARGVSAAEILTHVGPSSTPTIATELLLGEAGNVDAQTVTMERSGAERVSAERVIMTNSGAQSVEAKSAQVDRSGILLARSDKAVFANSSLIAAAVDEARIVRGRVFALKATNLTLEGDAKIGIYAGPASEGVKPLLDVQGALAVGAGIGAALVVLGAVARRLARR
jgi:hypothetical protein